MRKPLSHAALSAFLTLALAVLAHAAPLAQNGLVLVVRAGNGASGQPMFQVADSSDAGAKRIWDQIHNAPEVKRATAWYQQSYETKKQRIKEELSRDGDFSAADQRILDDLPGPYPVYVEVRPGTGGAYNDWKAQFDLQYADGRTERVAAPRIVFQANDPVVVGGDRALLRQTVVHEIAHGSHAVMVGQNNTPSTPWLSRPHAGNSTTDGTLALIEGYAEFVGAHLTDRKTIAGDPEGAVTSNLYVYGSDGKVKSAEDLWKTEGWAATVMYKMANDGKIDDAFEKINQTMAMRNPRDFRSFIEDFQELNPGDAQAVRATISSASMGQIYSGGGGGGGVGGGVGGGQTYDDDDEEGIIDKLFAGPGEGSEWGLPKIASMVVGGALGAVLAASMGPVGMVVAAGAGVGLGYLVGNYLFDQDRQSQSFDWGGRWARPFASGDSSSTVDDGPLPPTTPMAPSAARSAMDEAYKKYRKALSESPAVSEAVRLAREAYEKARAAYKASFGAR